MPIALATFVVAMGANWHSVGGQLLASGVLLLSGRQDIGWVRGRGGARFWFFMALAFATSALGTSISMKLWSGAAVCAVVFCFEIWLVRRWWSRGTSP